MKKILTIALGLAILSSCSTSSNVASNKLFQKRKYKKGWHINSTRSIEKSTEFVAEEFVATNEEEATEEAVVMNNEVTSNATETIQVTQEEVITNSSVEAVSESAPLAQTFETIITEPTSVVEEAIAFSPEERVVTMEQVKEVLENNSSNQDDDMLILLYILAVLIPFVAVGIVTDWDLKKVLINILLSFLCYIPGVIHAFITIRDYR